MDSFSGREIIIGRLKFIAMSLIGILLFLVPIPVEQDGQKQIMLPVAFSAGVLKDVLGGMMLFLIVMIITLSGIITLIYSAILKDKLKPDGLLHNAFNVRMGWLILRLFTVVFAWMTFLRIGSKVIYSNETGELLFSSLSPALVAIFLSAALLLPLLMEYGLLEMLDPTFRPVMRPLFILPGRSTVDNLISFIGNKTVGVLTTSRQYGEGYYSRCKATVISTTFSVASIAFTIVVAKTVHMQNQFFTFYLPVIVSCLVTAVIMPRVWPLSKIPDEHAKEVPESARTEVLSEGKTTLGHGFDTATGAGIKAPGIVDFFKSGLGTVVDMWFVILPVVMSIGAIVTIIADYMLLFVILGKPFIPFLGLIHIPEAAQASQTIIIGSTDMFLSSILIGGVRNDITRFVIGALSISQLVYLSEVGGVILDSKIPVSIDKSFMILLIRIIITLPIVSLMTHLLL